MTEISDARLNALANAWRARVRQDTELLDALEELQLRRRKLTDIERAGGPDNCRSWRAAHGMHRGLSQCDRCGSGPCPFYYEDGRKRYYEDGRKRLDL